MKNKIIQHFFAKDKGGEFKMALGILSIFMMSLFVLSFIFVWFMWTTKRQKLQQTMIYASFLLSLYIVWIFVVSLPSNFMMLKLVGWLTGGLSIIGIVGYYRNKLMLAKVLLTVSILLGLLEIVFL